MKSEEFATAMNAQCSMLNVQCSIKDNVREVSKADEV